MKTFLSSEIPSPSFTLGAALSLFAAFVLIAAFSRHANADYEIATSPLRIQFVDQSGAPVPGVVLELYLGTYRRTWRRAGCPADLMSFPYPRACLRPHGLLNGDREGVRFASGDDGWVELPPYTAVSDRRRDVGARLALRFLGFRSAACPDGVASPLGLLPPGALPRWELASPSEASAGTPAEVPGFTEGGCVFAQEADAQGRLIADFSGRARLICRFPGDRVELERSREAAEAAGCRPPFEAVSSL